MQKYHTPKINCSSKSIRPWIQRCCTRISRNSSSLLWCQKVQNSETLHSEPSEAEKCNRDLRCVRSSAKSWCCAICWGHFYKALPKACSTELDPTLPADAKLQPGHKTCPVSSATSPDSRHIRPATPHCTSVISTDLYLSSGLVTLCQPLLSICTKCSPESTSRLHGNTPTIEWVSRMKEEAAHTGTMGTAELSWASVSGLKQTFFSNFPVTVFKKEKSTKKIEINQAVCWKNFLMVKTQNCFVWILNKEESLLVMLSNVFRRIQTRLLTIWIFCPVNYFLTNVHF